MQDQDKTRDQLIAELAELRRQMDDLKTVAVVQAGLQAKLHESRALIDALFSTPTDSLALLDREGRLLACNETLVRRLGQPRDELLGTIVFDLFPPELAQARRQQVERVFATGQPVRFEDWRASMWLDNAISPVFDADGHVIRVVVIARDITDRHRAEAALRRSEARFRALVEQGSDVIALVDAEGRLLYASPTTRRVLGYVEDDILGRNVFDFIHPDDLTSAVDTLGDLARQPDMIARLEFRMRHKDGSWRWGACAGTNLLNKPGIQAIVINYRDITEQKQAERALRESEERFRLLASVSFEAIVLHERGTLLDVNDAFTRMFGYSVEQAVGMDALDCVIPEDRPLLAEHIRIQHQAPYEATGLRADGSTFPIEIIGKPMMYEGREARVVAVRDLTERKQAQEALAAEHALFRAVIDHLPDSVYVKDTAGRFLLVNARFIQDVGVSTPEEMLGKTDFDFFARENATIWRADEMAILQTGQPMLNKEEKSVDLLGQGIRTFLTSKVPLRDSQGQITRIVGITRDITDRKQAAQREMALKLEQERVRLLQRFLAGASHDLRTPLASLKASLAVLMMLRDAPDPDRERRHLDILETQTLHLERLLNDLMSIARMEEAIQLQRAPVQLNELVQVVIDRYTRLAERRQHTIHFNADESLPDILADARKLRRALGAFVTNALNYTPEGGEITLRTYRQDDHAVIEVQDVGIGVSESDLPHIFDGFFRADPSRPASTGGLGLGLSIARQLIDVHGGHIEVESTVGVGSTFKIFLPLDDSLSTG